MHIVISKDAPPAIGPYSQAIVHNDLVYTSGQIPLNAKTGELVNGGVKEQTRQVIQNLKDVLTAAGSDLEHVLKATCYLTDMQNFAAFNDMYAEYFTGRPARSCVAVSALPKGSLVEIEVVAERI
ncbi:MAG: RidA family protein [Dehalococcoidia bacterium]|nr:RidA family protein [Dehalococcoidia bacterium]